MPSEVDAFTRQQVYFEAVKENEAESFSDEIAALIGALILAELLALKVKRLSELSRREFGKLITRVIAAVKRELNALSKAAQKNLRGVFDVDAEVTAAIMEELAGEKKTPRQSAPALWEEMNNSIMPSVGEPATAFLAGYYTKVLLDLRRHLQAAFVDNLSITEFMRVITGGLLAKWQRDFKATTRTYLQYATNWLSQAIGKLYTDTYEWISVLDAGTTDICRSRAGRFYRYGEGPLPPAHYNCRSKTRPVLETKEPSKVLTFYAWVTRQPPPIQDAALGRKMADQLRKGNVGAKEIVEFVPVGKLTAAQYRTKVASILI